MIKVKRIYDAPATDDGYRILVDRLWPRGIKKDSAHIDLWMKDIAPETTLRKAYHQESISWSGFRKLYLKELSERSPQIEELKALEAAHTVITLLYASRDEERNHALLLQRYLQKK